MERSLEQEYNYKRLVNFNEKKNDFLPVCFLIFNNVYFCLTGVRFTIPENAGWIKANCDQYGYYRVNYNLDNWNETYKPNAEKPRGSTPYNFAK